MATIVVMPRFGATMEEGIVSTWAVKEGETVSKGDVLGEIEIEKLSNELLAEEDGVILKIIAEEGVAIACGQPIIIIGEPGEVIDFETSKEPEQQPALNQVADDDGYSANIVPSPTKQGHPGGVVTPKAQELADELGVDPSTVVGTGRMGMITREDIRRAYNEETTRPASIVKQAFTSNSHRKLSQMELAIANAMENSLRSTAQTTLTMDLDATNLVRYYQKLKSDFEQTTNTPTYTAIFIKIVAQALKTHPIMRTSLQDNQLVTDSEIHVGVAIDVDDGLVVPNIKHANRKSIAEISDELKELIRKAKNHTLKNVDISHGTFTITNLGSYGIKYFTPILNPGESGILGIGALQEIASIVDRGIFVKRVFNLSLTHDHRIINGVPAAKFLQTIQSIANALD
ncbi:MAG: dihydrolipoamide acetyltransferase family protein [Anaerolineaceae bacterium]|nr:dihydrolipoamide acetyltransferase family protein [Anaerolineaceae bacterium]